MDASTTIEADTLKQVRADMQAGRFQAAADQLDTLLSTSPDHVDTLYMRTVCARYLKDFDTAQRLSGRLVEAAPDNGRAWQEAGHLARDMGDPARALSAYQNAVRLNPALEAAWSAQASLLQAAGRMEEANLAAAQSNRLKSLPKILVAATDNLHEGKILKAEEQVRAFLQMVPNHVEGMRLLAEIGTRLGIHDDAEFLLETAIQLEPDNVQLRLDYIGVLRKRQNFAKALEEAQSLLERDPDNPVFQSGFAVESLQAGDYETALEMFDRVLEKLPEDPATLTSRGHALKTYGKTEDAIASYRAAYEALPQHGDAYYSLANLKTYRFSDAEITSMKAQLDRPELALTQRIFFCFALGKAYEDRKDAANAFRYFSQGNDLKRHQTRYTSEQMQEEFAAQKRYCTEELFTSQGGHGHDAPDPIFIVGLPRAGSTLLEQILASHSQVDGTLELPNILSLAHSLRGRNKLTDRDRYPRILSELPAEKLEEMGRDYIENTRIHRDSAPFFTDKMPNNFRHIGLIHLILPNAKIIDARRDPMDCCWSCFKQLFAEGQEFTYSLDDIGQYYRAYVDLMAHWDSVLPDGRILRVQHEDVLDDLEGQVRRILDYCGLPFEQACIDFHETQRAVRTASSEQVRQPINRSGQGQWKPYSDFLDPLRDALGPMLR